MSYVVSHSYNEGGALTEETATHRQRRLYYGWVIVGVMAAAGALRMALGTLNFGLFIKPMENQLGIGRASFGWALTARFVASAVTSPLVGSLIDRFGSRVLLALAAAITGAALVGVSQAWQLVGLFALMGIIAIGGPATLLTTVPVAKWFVRRRGRALAFVIMGNSLGGLVFLPLTQVLIDTNRWRNAWMILAGIGAGIIIPLSLLFVRRQPEDMGLAPDGASQADTVSPTTTPETRGAEASPGMRKTVWTLGESIRSSAFWRLVLAFTIAMLVMTSTGLHRIPHFIDRGLDAQLVAFAVGVESAVAAASAFAMGLLVERFQVRFVGAASYLLAAVATLLTINADTPLVLFLAMATWGTAIGGLILLQSFLWADYFGRQYLGSIRGIVMPLTLIVGALGAPLAGYVQDATGSYTSIWSVGIALLIVGAVVLAVTPKPQKEPAPR